MWLERPQNTGKFGSMCPWIRSVIASNLARAAHDRDIQLAGATVIVPIDNL
jgi:hypothetical protein